MRTVAIAAALLAFSALATDAAGARLGKRQLWGSIAYNSKSGAFGYAVDVKTKRDAETEAFRQCGDCDVIKTFRDSCGAIADSWLRVRSECMYPRDGNASFLTQFTWVYASGLEEVAQPAHLGCSAL